MTHSRGASTAPEQNDQGRVSNNRRTVESYERCARAYAADVSPHPSALNESALRRLADAAGPGGAVLEVGSGPGWDADYLESLGVAVRRTDVTAAFCEFQAERGKQIEPLDLLSDDLGGPYDAVVALCVLLHVDRGLTDAVLRKVAGALRPGGAFLASLREGEGDLWEKGDSGDYHVVLWGLAEFRDRLAAVGLRVDWHAQSDGRDGPWLTLLARKAP